MRIEGHVDGHLSRFNTVKHQIELNLPDVRPIHSQPYRAGPQALQFERDEIDKMLEMNIIIPCQTEWAAPVVFAGKRDGLLRFGVD